MTRRYLVLVARIPAEIADWEQTVGRAERAWLTARQGGEDKDLYLDAAALNLRDFYSGLERIFQRIAATVDEVQPGGTAWHRDLLEQMGLAVPLVRSSVLSRATVQALTEYPTFRYVVRNIYAFELQPERMSRLLTELGPLFQQVRAELEALSSFLEQAQLP